MISRDEIVRVLRVGGLRDRTIITTMASGDSASTLF